MCMTLGSENADISNQPNLAKRIKAPDELRRFVYLVHECTHACMHECVYGKEIERQCSKEQKTLHRPFV